MKDYERFFDRANSLHTDNSHSDDIEYIDIEDLYDAFKARLMDELNLESNNNLRGNEGE